MKFSDGIVAATFIFALITCIGDWIPFAYVCVATFWWGMYIAARENWWV